MEALKAALVIQPHELKRTVVVRINLLYLTIICARGAGFFDRVYAFEVGGNKTPLMNKETFDFRTLGWPEDVTVVSSVGGY